VLPFTHEREQTMQRIPMFTGGGASRRAALAVLALLVAATSLPLMARPASAADGQSPDVCTVWWDGGSGTPSWHDPGNWDRDELPGPDDVVCIENRMAGTRGVTYSDPVRTRVYAIHTDTWLQVAGGELDVTQSSAASGLAVDGGRLVVDTWFRAAEVSQTAGTVAGGGLLDITGYLTWTGGAQEGPGRTDVKNRADGQGGLYLSGTGDRTLVAGRGLEDVAGLRWTDGGVLHVDQASYANLGNSTIAATAAQIKGAGAVRTTGNLFVENSLLAIDGPLYSDATSTISVTGADGDLALYGGGDLHGDISLAADTELSIQEGRFAFRGDSAISGLGKVSVASGISGTPGAANVSVEGPYQVAETDISSNAWLHVPDGAGLGTTTVSEGGALEVVGGHVTTKELTLDHGDVWGAGTLTVEDLFQWGSGRLSGPGAVDVQGSTRLLGDGAERQLANRWLTTGDLYVDADGALAFTGDDPQLGVTQQFVALGHDLTVTGAGKVNPGNLTVDEATVTFEPQVNTDDGSRVVVSGEDDPGALILRGGGTHHADIDASGATLVLSGETLFATDSTITVEGGDLIVEKDGNVGFEGETQDLGHLSNDGAVAFGTSATAETADNTGLLTIGADRSLDVTAGSYTQTGEDAYTNIDESTSTLGATGGDVRILDGILGGAGLVDGNLHNGAEVDPDGTLTVVGNYTQVDVGLLTVDVNGAEHDELDVLGTAALAGAADIQITAAAPTAPFDILTSEGITGAFSSTSGAEACIKLFYTPVSVSADPQPCGVVATGSAKEDDGTIRFPVTLSSPSSQPVTIDYTPRSDSATAGDDFSAASGSITIMPGQTEGLITVPLVDDDQVEGNETLVLDLFPMGAVLANDHVVGTIVDDDKPPVEIPDLQFHEIPQSIDVGGVMTMNEKFVSGFHGVVIGDEQYAWVYNLESGTSGYVPGTRWINDINKNDHAVVECWDEGACFRQNKVNTELPSQSGYSSAPYALNDHDVIVGALYDDHAQPHAARWASPTEIPQMFGGLPGETGSTAVDVNDHGEVIGRSTIGGTTHAWIDIPDYGVLEITAPGYANIEPNAINEDGYVVGQMWNEDRGESHAFVWYGDDDPVDLGPGGANDINAKGAVVGWAGGGYDVHGELWIQEQGFDLNQIAGRPGYSIGTAVAINDAGAIAAEAGGPYATVPVALTPPGQGCKVCQDFNAQVQQFPNPDVWISTGNATVEGNTIRLRDTLKNNDSRTRTVSIQFFVDGEPYGADDHVATLEPGQSIDIDEMLDTNGMAFKDGLSAGPHSLQVSLAYEGGVPMQRTTIDMQVNPRPVVMVHGMNSNADTWAAYQSFLTAAHPGWKGFAIDTMDTSSSPPFTIAKNATKLAAFVDTVQRGQNAWQVDLVGHSMGGLISRSYISDLMPTNGGVRAVDRLVMLGTPNAGSPCADLLSTSVTYQLRTDVMATFNALHAERQGVPFSVAVGDWMPFTCQSTERGDLVVPVSSAAYGISDTATYDIAHTDMTGSHELFLQFVLPRLNGSLPATTPATGFAATSADGTTPGTGAPLASGPAVDPNPQMLMNFTDTVAPGASSEASFTVPAGTSAMGGVSQGDGNVEVQLVRHDRTVAATTGVDASLPTSFRSVAIDQPAAAQWLVRVINHGATPVTVPVAVWAHDLPEHLSATATQVDELGRVHVSSTLSGNLPGDLPERMLANLSPSQGGEVQTVTLYDDGGHGDGAAGDHTYANDATLTPQGWSVMVTTDFGMLLRYTTTSVDVSFGTDDPSVNDAPRAFSATVSASRNSSTSVDLKGTDPEGSALTYEIVRGPSHGQLGGGDGGPHFQYASAKDYLGPDSFTFRVHDGQLYSPPATVTIDVGREPTQLKYVRPLPAESTKGRTVYGVTVQLVDNALKPMEDAPVELRFAGTTYPTQTTLNGYAGVNLDGRVPAGTYDLEVVFPGDATHAPVTMHQPFKITDGVAPQPEIEGPIQAEAGYPENVLVRGNDLDADSATFELDVEGDGTWDQVDTRDPASNGVDYGHTFVVTYPAAFDGTIRARVTDAAGHVVETTSAVHVAPHRPLGALQRLVDDRGERLDGNGNGGTDASGRYVLHQVSHDEVDGATQPLAVLDRTTGTDEIVSVMPDGTVNDHWPAGVISANGRYVAFRVSTPVGALLPFEVFLRDRVAGTTIPVSVNAAGQFASWSASAVSVTDDGRVLFVSNAGNLGVVPPNCGSVGQTVANCDLLWLRDPSAGTTTLVSHDDAGNGIPVKSSTNDMTADGRYVVWGDNHKVWLWDATTGQATRQGIAIGGADSNGSDIGASNFQLSEDGTRILFNSTGTNLAPGDTDSSLDVFLFDRTTGMSSLVSRATNGEKANNGSYDAVMSGDGRVVSFSSLASNLVAGDDADTWDVFVRDLGTGVTTRVSEEARDHLQPDNSSYAPHLSCDGRWVVFTSDAENIVPGDVNLRRDSYVFDRGAAASRPCAGSTPVNHAPVAAAGSVTTAEDTAVAVGLAGTDQDGDALTFAVTAQPEHGTLSGEGASLTYTPAPDFHGTDSVGFTVSDGQVTSEAAAVAITVSSVNDAPIVSLVAPAAVDEGSLTGLDVQATDVDGDPLTVTWATSTGALTGSGTHVTLGSVDGPATATVTAEVSDGTTTEVRTATVQVRNIAPTADAGADVSVPTGTVVTFTGSARDPGPVDTAAGLTTSWAFGDGATAAGLTATHAYAKAGTYQATFTVTDRDGAATTDTATVTVTTPAPQPKPAPKLAISTTNGTYGFAATSAKLTDPTSGAPLAGKVVTFTLAGRTLTGTTDATGVARVPAVDLRTGSYTVTAATAADDRYGAASANGSLTVTNSVGRVTAVALDQGGIGGLLVTSDGREVSGVMGWLSRYGISGSCHFTGIGISPNKKAAWISGRSWDGRDFVVYVEDNGGLLAGRDVFRLWIGGVERTSGSTRLFGDVTIK